MCGILFEPQRRGRPREYCGRACRDIEHHLRNVELLIDRIYPVRGSMRRMRSRLWALANQLNDAETRDRPEGDQGG